ncbi:MAG: glutamine synthetase family protein [Rhodospirillales bacterium]|nr:glutamine synthetase family protein [Rhodospirillales bacterium]
MSDYERIRVLFCDHLNLARGKYVPRAMAETGSLRQCVGVYAVDYERTLIPAPGSGVPEGLPDMEAVFDLDRVRPGWEPGTGVVVANLEKEGQPLGLCARGALARAIAAWQQAGLAPFLGIELEAFVFQRDSSGNWVPYDTPGAYVYGTGTAVDPAGLVDDIWSQAQACGFPLEAINSEFDWPQFEFTLRYRDALGAIDDIFLFRLMAREVAAKRGYLLSFMPKPLSDRGGSGVHLNLSLADSRGDNALADPAQEDGLSELTRRCIAGLMYHHRSMAGLIAPTVNSYRRLRPASLAGYWANWGYDHRGVAVRVPGERGLATRIEHRVADGAANPYVAAAAMLQVARLGVESGYPLPPAETGDGLENVDTDVAVPENLGAALDALEQDDALVSAIGALLVANHIGIKRKEWDDYLGSTTDWEMSRYLNFL